MKNEKKIYKQVADASVQRSIDFGNNRKLLKERLYLIYNVFLTQKEQKNFGDVTFDFKNKRLIGSGKISLQWKTRKFPDLPETADNLQEVCGYVEIVKNKDILK